MLERIFLALLIGFLLGIYLTPKSSYAICENNYKSKSQILECVWNLENE
jgi:uncharacterized protein YneF (UPF0154 family)